MPKSKLTWMLLNVKGARSHEKLSKIAALIQLYNIDIYILTETNSTTNCEKQWTKLLPEGRTGYILVPPLILIDSYT